MIKTMRYEPIFLINPFIIYLLLFFSPLSSKAHDNFFYLVILLPFIIFARLEKEELYTIVKSKGFLSILIFVSYLALTVISNIQTVPFSKLAAPIRHLFSFIVYFYLCVLFFYKYELIGKIKFVCLWAGIWAVISIAIYYWKFPFMTRLVFLGPVQNPILGSCIYALMFLFLFFSENTLSNTLKFFTLLSLLACVVLSQSRGPILALLAAVFVGLVSQGQKKAPALIGFGIITAWLLDYLNLISFGRIFWASSSFRLQIWEKVISSMVDNKAWLFGFGVAADETVIISSGNVFTHAHSGYIGTFFMGGIIGLALLLNLLFHVGRQSISMRSSKQEGVIVSMLVFSSMVIATDTHKLLLGPDPIWLFFWLPLAYLVSREIRKKRIREG